MQQKRRMGSPPLLRHRTRGQSIPLIALMIVVLVAMVGLSVDVGNTFAEERRVVAATNAASLAAMETYLGRTSGTTNGTIYDAVDESLRSNGVDVEKNTDLKLEVMYLNSQGGPLENASPIVSAGDSARAPDNVAFIEVRVQGTVDTFFARAVGRDTLPLNASAHAGKCDAGPGVYPIAVDSDLIREDEFINPGAPAPGAETVWWKVESGIYKGYTKRRIYVHDINVPGGFSWLQWVDGKGSTGSNAGSAKELDAAMTGTGTLGSGFEEVVPWPSSNLPAPATYPEKPGRLNPGDWIHGNSGYSMSNAVSAAMDGHIANGTRMILPIYDVALGNGANSAFRVVRLGLFVLTDYGKIKGKPYIDLIFLGDPDPQETACLATPPPPPTEKFNLVGNISIMPEYTDRSSSYKPVQYVVVFDVSGSMNMNFIGQGFQNGQIIQCTNGPPGSPPNQDCGKPEYAWPTVEQRRIYVAKKAIELLVKQTNMPGNPGYDPAKPNDTMALVWFNAKSPTSWTRGFRTEPASIISDVMSANAQNGNPFLSEGGTNGAAGLYRAGEFLQNAPKDTNELGKVWPYRRVVIFITDGVSNTFLNTGKPDLDGGNSNWNTYPDKPQVHYCRTLGNTVRENALCQTTDVGGTHKGMDRPISQMVKVAGDSIKFNNAVKGEIYVLALSSIPETGLKDGVASTSNHFFAAETLEVNPSTGRNNVDEIMILINKQVETSACKPLVDPWQTTFGQTEFVSGEATITNATDGTPVTVPITLQPDGKLSYRFLDIPRGTYTLESYIIYKHSKDGVSRVYNQIFANEEDNGSSITVVVDSASQTPGFETTVRQDLDLKLYGNVCAAP